MTKEKTKEKNQEKVLKDQISDLKDTLQRVQADFENYMRRTEKEKQENIKFACQDAIIELLPVLDNFELALKHTSKEKDFIKGIELVYAQFIDIMSKLGLEPIKALGENFDPKMHEVLMLEESKKNKHKIIEEFQKGYTLNGRVIRASKVKVTK